MAVVTVLKTHANVWLVSGQCHCCVKNQSPNRSRGCLLLGWKALTASGPSSDSSGGYSEVCLPASFILPQSCFVCVHLKTLPKKFTKENFTKY